MSEQFNIDYSKIILFSGDCLEEMKKISSNSVHLIAADPPYGTTQNKWDVIIPFEPLWSEIKRVLTPSGIVVFTAMQPFASQLILSNVEWFKYDLIWQKTIGSGQLNIRHQPLRVHENILVFYKRLGTYNEQLTEGKPYTINRKAKDFVVANYGQQRDHIKVNTGIRHATSIIKIANPRVKGGHPTQKPISLFEYIVKVYSNEYDTVLDFSMGSGTTGVACINLKRNFIGIELDKKWYDFSLNRLKGMQLFV